MTWSLQRRDFRTCHTSTGRVGLYMDRFVWSCSRCLDHVGQGSLEKRSIRVRWLRSTLALTAPPGFHQLWQGKVYCRSLDAHLCWGMPTGPKYFCGYRALRLRLVPSSHIKKKASCHTLASESKFFFNSLPLFLSNY